MTMLRASNSVPALKRRMAKSETELRDRHRHAAVAGGGDQHRLQVGS